MCPQKHAVEGEIHKSEIFVPIYDLLMNYFTHPYEYRMKHFNSFKKKDETF